MSFDVGQRVRTSARNPAYHYRLPTYARGKAGVVVRRMGRYGRAEFAAQGRKDPEPQETFVVRFAAEELWGEGDFSVHVDLWEQHLEPLDEPDGDEREDAR